MFAGFGEGCFAAGLSAVLLDADRPGVSLLHSPLVLAAPAVLLPTEWSRFFLPAVVGLASHLFLDGLTRDGILLYPGGRFPDRETRSGLPSGNDAALNLGVSVLSLGAVLYFLL